ncbi:MAG: DUF3526 domain-containing protein [Pseudomonadota bacterium]
MLFIEGHRQGVPLHTDAGRGGSVARFARLDGAFLLQTVVPLLLIFLGAAGLAADRESGRLKLLLVQGGNARAILGGHFLILWTLALVLLLVVVTTSLLTSAVMGGGEPPPFGRLGMLLLTHALFFAVVAAASVAATVWFDSARGALLALLAGWVVATVLLPRATAGVAGTLYPLPSQDVFQAEMQAARQAGPDGHNPEDAELERLQAALLAEHGVETVEELPMNFDGIAMQVDEEFGNQVWDEHYGRLRDQLRRQGTVGSAMAILNPFQAVDHISMALAGTDLAHDLAFQAQAEGFRRTLVEALNREHAYGGSKTGDWSWEAPPEFFAALPAYEHASPALATALRPRVPDLTGLVLWLAGLLIAMRTGASRLERGQLMC